MATTEIERRTTFSDATIEYRDAENGEKRPVIVGYASVFDSESRNLGGFVETVHPRAFDDVLSTNPDVLGLFNHDKNKLLARTGNGSLKLAVDSRGLRYEMSLPATRDAEDVATMVKERLVTGSSFAFAVKRHGGDEWRTDDRGMKHREIRSISLLEDVGPVVRPAYDASSVVVSRRAIEMALGENYRPNQTMSNAARRGLRIAEKRDDIDTRLLVIAERVMNRDVLSIEEVDYLSEVHERCLAAKAANWNGTTPHVEWLLCGGDSGEKWVEKRSVRDSRTANSEAAPPPPAAEEERDDDVQGTLSPANEALYGATEGIVAAHGKWPQGGPAGAHYIEISPFGESGLRCENCAFFEAGACEVVQGSISADGICKLWVIPEEKMSKESTRSETTVADESAATETAPPVEETPAPQADATPAVDESLAAQIKLAELNAVLLRTRLQASTLGR